MPAPGAQGEHTHRGEVVLVFAEVSLIIEHVGSPLIMAFVNSSLCAKGNLTVFGNISGEIPAAHKIIVINVFDSGN